MGEVAMASQMTIGRGINTANGGVFGTALDKVDAVASSTAQVVQYELRSLTSSEDLTEKLRVSASASFKAAWGASIEFNLQTSKQINSYYTYSFIKCHVQNAPRLIRNAQLSTYAYELLDKNGWDRFEQSYGPEYVEGVIEGGAYYAVIEIRTQSTAEKSEIETKLSGYYGPFAASAEFEHTLAQIQKTHQMNVTVIRTGGTGQPINTDFKTMLEESRNFPAIVAANPVPFVALTAEYKNTVQIPNVSPPDSLPRIQQKNTLDDLGRHYLRMRDKKANLEFVLTRQLSEFDEFREFNNAELQTKKREYKNALDKINDEINEIVSTAERCSKDYQQCQAYSPEYPDVIIPSIKGELLSIKQLEDRLYTLEQALQAQGLMGGGTAQFTGNLTVGAGGVGLIKTRLIEGKAHGHDGTDDLHLNWDNGRTVHVGGGAPASIHVHGDAVLDPGRTINANGPIHVNGTDRFYIMNKGGAIIGKGWGGNGNLSVEGRIGTQGHDPENVPKNFGGGVHTWDVYAEGGVYSGSGGIINAGMNSKGTISGKDKRFVIPHPSRPAEAVLSHGAIEGPELAVYYRGESSTNEKGMAKIELPEYFESLTRTENRTVLVSPISSSSDPVAMLSVSDVKNGSFVVRTEGNSHSPQRFFWEVKAVRADVDPLEVVREKK